MPDDSVPNSSSQILALFTLVVLLLDVVEVGTVVLLLVVEPTVLLLVEPTVLLDDELVGSGAVGLCESPHATTTSPAKHMASRTNAREGRHRGRCVRDESVCLAAICMTLHRTLGIVIHTRRRFQVSRRPPYSSLVTPRVYGTRPRFC